MDERTLQALREGKICPIEIQAELSGCAFTQLAEPGTEGDDGDGGTEGAG